MIGLHIETSSNVTIHLFFNGSANNRPLTSKECPILSEPDNGKTSCRKISGKTLCFMSCDEGHSFSTEAVTAFVCGPDTVWKWNGLDDLTIPSCLSTYMFRCLLSVFCL